MSHPLDSCLCSLSLITNSSSFKIIFFDFVSSYADWCFSCWIIANFYLIYDLTQSIPEEDDVSAHFTRASRFRYYFLPCLFLFYRSDRLLKLVLHIMGSLVCEEISSCSAHHSTLYTAGFSSRIGAIVSILGLIYADIKIKQILLLCKEEIERILQKILALQVSWTPNSQTPLFWYSFVSPTTSDVRKPCICRCESVCVFTHSYVYVHGYNCIAKDYQI